MDEDVPRTKNLPPEVEKIFKQFTKAAIRTQPTDLLAWSAAYFRALVKADTLPLQMRIDAMLATREPRTFTRLTQEEVRYMDIYFSRRKKVCLEDLQTAWAIFELPSEQLDELIKIGKFFEWPRHENAPEVNNILWDEFFALCVSALADSILEAMIVICQLRNKGRKDSEPAVKIPYDDFKFFYTYLATVDGDISKQQIGNVLNHLSYDAELQDGFITPRNFLSLDCPSLS